MNCSTPHFLLFSESDRTSERGQWRFVLQSLDGTEQLEAADSESDIQGERLELLAVVRGLEALPQPSRVTLVTPSRYVNRGLHYGLAKWRSNDWQWEHFGEMAPIKNRDLWQRIDRALAFHSVDCRLMRFDAAEAVAGAAGASVLAGPHFLRGRNEGASAVASAAAQSEAAGSLAASHVRPQTEVASLSRFKCSKPAEIFRHLGCQTRRRWFKLCRRAELAWESAVLRFSRLGTRLLPPPWLG